MKGHTQLAEGRLWCGQVCVYLGLPQTPCLPIPIRRPSILPSSSVCANGGQPRGAWQISGPCPLLIISAGSLEQRLAPPFGALGPPLAVWQKDQRWPVAVEVGPSSDGVWSARERRPEFHGFLNARYVSLLSPAARHASPTDCL